MQTNSDKLVSDFIYKHPDIVAKVLADNNVPVALPLTLTSITQSTFTEMYNGNKKFINDLNYAIAQDGYSNFIPLVIGAALSVSSLIGGARAAKKARDLQAKIALANLSQEKLLGEENIRSGAETDRTKILLQTLQQYQSDLQAQSTQRIKDTWVFLGIISSGIGIIYGLSILLTSDK